MKLPDFTQHDWLNSLRKKSWTILNSSYKADCVWDPSSSTLLEEGELWGLDLQDVSINADETLSYRGHRIVLYLREQQEQWGEWAYKFHFYDCATLNLYRDEWLHNWEYVVNISARFSINKMNFGRITQRNVAYPLQVCKNCLKESNYKDYNAVDYTKKNFIYKRFSREEYFGR